MAALATCEGSPGHILDRHKARDLEILKRYRTRADVEQYTSMLKTVLALFGEAIKESLTRTMADYLDATGGRLRNAKNRTRKGDSK